MVVIEMKYEGEGKDIYLVYCKVEVAIEKTACGNLEYWHGDRRCRCCSVKRLLMNVSGIEILKLFSKELFNPVISLGDAWKCIANMKIERM